MSKSKYFRVATEGASTDGRKIERSWIQQMAKNFNRAKYGARVWLEHYRGTVPGGPFDALGDVVAVEAREVDGGKLALFAQIDPTPALVEMNKKRQKLYTSIEVFPEFADTGEAYLTGLAVTEALAFTAQRKTDKAVLFSEGIEFELQMEDDSNGSGNSEGGAISSVMNAFSKLLDKLTPSAPIAPISAPVQQPFTNASPEITAALTKSGEVMLALSQQQAKDSSDVVEVKKSVEALTSQVNDLVNTLTKTPGFTARPAATGGSGKILANC